MNKCIEKDNVAFSISEADVQSAAMENIGRKLADEEMQIAKKRIGLGAVDWH
ncbi:MAG: hypothetical protein LBD99_04445 [Candidatus Margulisbacteria bacterium]|jgi:hypothetical protein|nr:hypothetical protein [Candidatus Margulisiibacteriota bacterium]